MNNTTHSPTMTSKQNIQAIINERINPKETIYYRILTTIGFLLGAISVMIVLVIKMPLMLAYTNSIPLAVFYALRPLLIILAVCFSLLLLLMAIAVGGLKGNSVKITAKQFPAIYAIMEKQAKALGMDRVPTGYVLHGHGIVQAFAFRYLRGDYIILFSDLVATAQKDQAVLAFIIGHELGHVKLRHNSFRKNFFLISMPILRKAYTRAREYSCDAIAQYLVPEAAEKGIALLAVGKHLYEDLDIEEYIRSATEDKGFTTWWSELLDYYPHLNNRLEAVRKWSKK